MDTIGRCTTSYLLVGPTCFWCLVIGDNFLVLAKLSNLKFVDFFLFQCVKCMEIVQEDKGLNDYGFFVELDRDEI
jgi:hypothetical protein